MHASVPQFVNYGDSLQLQGLCIMPLDHSCSAAAQHVSGQELRLVSGAHSHIRIYIAKVMSPDTYLLEGRRGL